MNKIYKVKWSAAKQTWVACSERSKTKLGKAHKGLVNLTLTIILVFGMAPWAWSAPAACVVTGDTLTCPAGAKYDAAAHGGKTKSAYAQYIQSTVGENEPGLMFYSGKDDYQNVELTTTGTHGDGIKLQNWAPTYSFQNLTIRTQGASADGINISRDAENGKVTIYGNTAIETKGGMGLRSVSSSLLPGNQYLILKGDAKIVTHGTGNANSGYGVYAGLDVIRESKGEGHVWLQGQNSQVTTFGDRAHALFAQGRGVIKVDNVELITSGKGAHGVYALRDRSLYFKDKQFLMQDYAGQIELIGNVNIKVSDPSAYALMADNLVADTDPVAAPNGPLASIRSANQDGVYAIKGNILAKRAGLIDLIMANGSQWTGAVATSDQGSGIGNGVVKLALNGPQSEWVVTADSNLTELSLNGSVVRFKPTDASSDQNRRVTEYKRLVIAGDYQAKNMPSLYMNTQWNALNEAKEPNFFSDYVEIQGHASGVTRVIPVDKKGVEGVIEGDVAAVKDKIRTLKVISAGSADQGAFIGVAKTRGLAEAQLAQSGSEFYWTIDAAKPDPVEPVEPVDPINPVEPVDPKGPEVKRPDSWAPEVAAYLQMPTANMALGYAMVGSLHERLGQNPMGICEGCRPEEETKTWTRVFAKDVDRVGKSRLSFDGDVYVVQMGHDFDVRQNGADGTRRHSGVMLSYGHFKNSFYDRHRTVNSVTSADKHTGKAETDSGSIGLYSTYYTAEGGYLDLVGQMAFLRNKYQARNGTKVNQNGWSSTLSAEIGRPLALKKYTSGSLFIEPQAQLIYQYLNLKDFNDGLKEVRQDNAHAVRGRLGARLVYNEVQKGAAAKTFYGVANLWHDFASPKSVHVGDDSYREKYNQTWGEVGLGLQVPTGKNAHFYADARYEHSFGGARIEGYRGTLGFKYAWQ
ncbi:MAG: autotransporter outer membrane beta-barrel domain-containing protein [Neisseriaceae bacterium]|nr:autotransporter outer membrane beta-barrel domain-containing protein [Neisseriaceae bacterium]